jgi:predicted amidophosphoribosyltransferase
MSEHTEFSDDDLDEREYPEEDEADDDDLDTVECPECHRQIYEELEQCPHCGQYITHDTRAWPSKPWWWTALALAGIAGLIWALVVGG